MQALLEKLCCAFCFKSKKDKNGAVRPRQGVLVGDVDMKVVSRKAMRYKLADDPNEEIATFGAGCYWGTERWFTTKLQEKYPDFLYGYAVGFMSPELDAPKHPTYREVCSKLTSHVEVFHLRFDNSKISYRELVKHFFTFHDPTLKNRQGQDKGPQYASQIYYHSEEQKNTAIGVMDQVQDLMLDHAIECYKGYKVMTKIQPATAFYAAHLKHQEYLVKRPNGYCNHRKRFDWTMALERKEEIREFKENGGTWNFEDGDIQQENNENDEQDMIGDGNYSGSEEKEIVEKKED